jgi:isocitrate dehydrogenase kinase/phosphatase
LGDRALRSRFMSEHADLLDVTYWQSKQARIRAGVLEDVFPYPESARFPRARAAACAIVGDNSNLSGALS